MAWFYCRTLQAEYDRLRIQQEHNNNERNLQTQSDEFTNHDAEMIAEAKLLRQHKGRLEARMRILEDHNRQLEAQLQRLRILLEQVSSVAKLENSTLTCHHKLVVVQDEWKFRSLLCIIHVFTIALINRTAGHFKNFLPSVLYA